MFLSGNEVYWHTRLEASIDGSATPNRTIVCYKDSWESSKIDPGEGTPTWRDPAQPAPAGSQPENALTGTIYMSNFTDLPITVSSAQGKTRLWRGTSLASLPAGIHPGARSAHHRLRVRRGPRQRPPAGRPDAPLRDDWAHRAEDPERGRHPGGARAPRRTASRCTAPPAVRSSSAPARFSGDGASTSTTTATTATPPTRGCSRPRSTCSPTWVRSPTTLMAGLVQPTPSTDTSAPSVTVTAPGAGANLGNGASVTVSGTASDAGGGVVTTVEVSLDGGQTYHRATGTTSWSYTGVLSRQRRGLDQGPSQRRQRQPQQRRSRSTSP